MASPSGKTAKQAPGFYGQDLPLATKNYTPLEEQFLACY